MTRILYEAPIYKIKSWFSNNTNNPNFKFKKYHTSKQVTHTLFNARFIPARSITAINIERVSKQDYESTIQQSQ